MFNPRLVWKKKSVTVQKKIRKQLLFIFDLQQRHPAITGASDNHNNRHHREDLHINPTKRSAIQHQHQSQPTIKRTRRFTTLTTRISSLSSVPNNSHNHHRHHRLFPYTTRPIRTSGLRAPPPTTATTGHKGQRQQVVEAKEERNRR